MKPLEALRRVLAGERIDRKMAVRLRDLGWLVGKYKNRRVPEGFKWVANGDYYAPMQCPKCGAVHFPQGANIGKCAMCREPLLAPDWVGECPWPHDTEKTRWLSSAKKTYR